MYMLLPGCCHFYYPKQGSDTWISVSGFGCRKQCKGLITLCVDSLAFVFFSRFSRVFPRNFDTKMLVTKTREKREKNQKREPNARQCFYITLCVGKKRESVAFFSRFSRVLLAFFSRFCSQTQTKSIV